MVLAGHKTQLRNLSSNASFSSFTPNFFSTVKRNFGGDSNEDTINGTDSKGLGNQRVWGYPLLGLTGTHWLNLTPETRLLFGSTKATYLQKGRGEVNDALVQHIVSSRAITQVLYGGMAR